MNSNDIFTIMRNARTLDVKLDSIYSQDESEEVDRDKIISSMVSESNLDYLTNAIFDTADPLRNSGVEFTFVKNKVLQYINAWKALGKFDKLKNYKNETIATVSLVSMIQSFDKEFVEAFANKIIAFDDPTKVKSITDPSGMFAQQTRSVTTTSKRIPFYERALYKRLVDRNLDIQEDETENLFYMMDHNPKLTDAERKKTNPTVAMESCIDREGMSFRMIPKY